jgi:glycosyltransferase involved in cell wall biosynthesis
MTKTLVIIPALNEEASLPTVVRDLREHAPECDLLVIDDGSTDGTAEAARDAGARVVSLPFNMGVGTALRTGFRYADRHGYDRVVQTDADGQHDAAQIRALVCELDRGADLVIGSRFVSGDGHYEVERSRGLAMSVLRVSTRLLIGRTIHDSTSGFRGFSRPLIESFSRSYPREFLSDTVEALLMAGYAGHRISEVPVTMRHRMAGEPSHRSFKLAYHYVRLLVVMVLTVSPTGRRTARRKAAA